MLVEGVKVVVEECSHCKLQPTDSDVQGAVKKAQEMRATPRHRCAYCGEAITALSYKMHHDENGWQAWEDEVESCITMEIQPSNGARIPELNALHKQCIPKALPFVNGLAQ